MRQRMAGMVALWAVGAVWTVPALAHTAEGAFVLLLPTEVYRAAGVAVVAVTVLALAILPERWVGLVFANRPFAGISGQSGQELVSLTSFALMCGALWIGATGP